MEQEQVLDISQLPIEAVKQMLTQIVKEKKQIMKGGTISGKNVENKKPQKEKEQEEW